MQEHLGCEDELTFKAATGLGGGVGRMGDICGALSGGVLAIGLQHGRATQEDQQSGPKTYALTEKLYGMFEKEMGSPTCYDITQTNLRNEEERKQWADQGGHQRCRELVKQTARMVKQVIEEN
jgi:C_GCAxxG_C_C family probable redox protein